MLKNEHFDNLNYSIGDEDYSIEMELISSSIESVLCIAGSGARVIPLLSKNPAKLVCVDISRPQLELTRLRISSIKIFDHENYLKLFGYSQASVKERLSLLSYLYESNISVDFLKEVKEYLHRGGRIIYAGGFEKMLITLSKVIKLVMGKYTNDISNSTELAGQIHYYRNHFPMWRWKLVLSVLANAKLFNALLYKGSFPQKTINKSYYKVYRDIFDNLFNNVEIKKSYFLQLVLLGEIRYQEAFPPECRIDVFNSVKNAISNTEIIYKYGDIYDVKDDAHLYDYVSLSDAPSFALLEAENYLQRLKPIMNRDAIVVSRFHVREVVPKLDGFRDITSDYRDLVSGDTTGLWVTQIFRKVQ